MAHWTGKGFKKDLRKIERIVHFFDPEPSIFSIPLNVDYLEYEDAGYIDNRCLQFTVWSYSKYSKKSEVSNRIFLSLCLLPEFVQCLRRYDPEFNGEAELGIFYEHQGLNKRFVVKQNKGIVHLIVQLKKTAWENYDGIRIKKEWLLSFQSFLKCFCQSHLEEIKLSCERRKQKQEKWTTTVPARY